MNRLYLPSGYLNVPYIDSLADKHGISFVVLIGGRQVGKTYGTLKLMLDDNRRFILMRRTQAEAAGRMVLPGVRESEFRKVLPGVRNEETGIT